MPDLSQKQIKVQRFISVGAVALLVFVGLLTLVKIENLYQTRVYVQTAFAIYAVLLIWMYFIFDLHFKPGKEPIVWAWHFFKRRFHHFMNWQHFRHFQNYLVLPGMLYWGAVIIIGINFQRHSIQNFVAIVTSVALVLSFSLFKEIFHSKKTPIENSHFVVLTYVKLYAAWLVYSGALGIVWYFCLPPFYFYFLAFIGSLMLLYQALFQFDAVSVKNVRMVVGASFIVTLVSYFVFHFWNVNYFSAGIFLAAVYNILWGFIFHWCHNNLTREIILEHIAIFTLIAILVFGSTNFRATIDRCGERQLVPPIYYQ
jgi:hypothetical protein